MTQKDLIEKYKSDKESIVSKLNTLSVENIKLLNANDELLRKLQSLDFPKNIKNNEPNLIYQELHKKSEKIKELNFKLEEMYSNEIKLLHMVDTFKKKKTDFEELYEQACPQEPVKDTNYRKKIPNIKIEALEDRHSIA